MGIDYNVYLGPYIECEFEYKEVFHSLCDRSCPRGHIVPTAKYCPECGLEIKWKQKEIVPTVQPYRDDILGHDDLVVAGQHCFPFPDKNHHIWIPNRPYLLGIQRRLYFDLRSEKVMLPVDDVIVSSEFAAFCDVFRDTIKVLESVYKSCHVGWGLLMYTS